MVSEKCEATLEALDEGEIAELCLDSKEVRRMVGCLAVRLRDNEDYDFGDSVREAWARIKNACAEVTEDDG